MYEYEIIWTKARNRKTIEIPNDLNKYLILCCMFEIQKSIIVIVYFCLIFYKKRVI